ncbi:CYTH and CHAD domain-containing protein [Streptomyces sp. NP160]|uniref:CYTH and CHAD domain-containing protein n=1 Tax=Streptomyces sp. NP160 TaxID=2586637 RepID=UPI00111AF538|nr:CYTH and CHAD domain-containing protein [Streptomyces sp. NP160]TNM64422.1 CYTH and CHAD domain-containing protein [Streptomyces sp. NP160]
MARKSVEGPAAGATGGVSTSRETERKFSLAEDAALPDLAGAGRVASVDDVVAHDMVAVYYDTADLRLAREGVTLRRRQGGSDDGWHLKLPVGSSSDRDELSVPLSDGGEPPEAAGQSGPPTVPAALTALVTALVRISPLGPVAELRTHREVHVLRDAEGRALAEAALDDVEVAVPSGAGEGSAGVVPGRFRELEVELLDDGEESDLDAVSEALVAAGAVLGAQVSKARRALGTPATAAPDVPEPGEVGPRSSAADLVRASTAEQVRALRRHDLGVRRGEDDAVHQMRVAARRLRSGLRVFRPLLDREWADDLRAELAWLAGELGAARDGEVLAERLSLALAALPAEVDATDAARLLQAHLDEQHRDGEAVALAALGSQRYAALLDRLVDAATAPPTTEAAEGECREVLPPLVRTAWKKLAREVTELRMAGDDDSWHEARKTAKRVRYAAEAVTPALGKPAKKFAKQVERVTELLGQHQDAAVAADVLAHLATDRSRALHLPRSAAAAAKVGFALGSLHAAQRAEVRVLRADLLDIWPEVSHGGHRAWLG